MSTCFVRSLYAQLAVVLCTDSPWIVFGTNALGGTASFDVFLGPFGNHFERTLNGTTHFDDYRILLGSVLCERFKRNGELRLVQGPP